MRSHMSLAVIIAAAMMLEVSTAVMYYSAQTIVQKLMEQLTTSEMNAIYLGIRNHLAKVEITLDNMAWVETYDLTNPESLYGATYLLVEHNPDILGSSISCVPYLYPQHGRLFEAFAVRRPNGKIESMQLGSKSHDYTTMEFYKEPIARGTGHWCEPYLDRDGAKTIVTTYAVPVRNTKGKIVAVVDADISLDWLNKIMNEEEGNPMTQRYIVTGRGNILAGEDTVLCKKVLEEMKAYGDYGYFTTDYGEDEDKKHVFYTPVGGKTDWMLISVVDDAEVFGSLRMMRHFLLLLILAGLVLVWFITWRTSRNLEHLRKVNAEKARISSELRVASQIQQNMLPQNYLKNDLVEIYGSLVPAREVGGDLFDYFIHQNKLSFYIGDVSGKGTPAALMMASTRSLLRGFSAHASDLSQIIREVNEAVCEGNDSCMFVTLFLGVLDLSTGHLRYCNAGHDAPIILSNGQWSMLDAMANLPIGCMEDTEYEVQETWIQPDSTIFLYTDGLTEAMNGRQLFGIDQVKATLNTCTDSHPKEILDTISEAVHRFVGNSEQSDDLTMLAIRYTPPKGTTTENKKTIKISINNESKY